MTREEALSIMQVIVHMLEKQYDNDRVEEAVDMAIAALKAEPCDRLKLDGMLEDAYEHGYQQARHDYETQPCEDCISRAEVNKLLDLGWKKGIYPREAIKALPSVQPESRWIPVSEMLPSDCNEDWVLAQIIEPDTGYLWIPCVAEYRKGLDDWYTDSCGLEWVSKHEGSFKVIAWTPLPKQYRADMRGGE